MAGLYRGPIIDPHCHLWDLGMDRHPWLRPTGGAIQALGDLAPIRRNYLVDDYRRDAANQNVVASVHIEAAWDRADDPLAEIRVARDARQVVRRRHPLHRLRRPRRSGRGLGARPPLRGQALRRRPADAELASDRASQILRPAAGHRGRAGFSPRRHAACPPRPNPRVDALSLPGRRRSPGSRATSPTRRSSSTTAAARSIATATAWRDGGRA